MTAEPARHVRGQLQLLGMRRRWLRQMQDELAQETAEALRLARGKVPMVEAASLAGVSRSTAYVALGEEGDDDGQRSTEGPT